MTNTILYRFARDDDATDLISLIDRCYREYDGCILDVDAEEPQLRHIATYFSEKRGKFWVAERMGELVGSVGYVPNRHVMELKHLYVNSSVRKQGLGSSLCGLVERAALEQEASSIKLWTDTRFEDAHRLYERLGFVGGALTRKLQDLSKTTEYYYEKALRSS